MDFIGSIVTVIICGHQQIAKIYPPELPLQQLATCSLETRLLPRGEEALEPSSEKQTIQDWEQLLQRWQVEKDGTTIVCDALRFVMVCSLPSIVSYIGECHIELNAT